VRRITGTGTPAAVLASHDYYPFGVEATASTDGERMKHTGHEWDVATALDPRHTRHCNFGVGRFLSTDPTPKSIDADRPKSWNRHTYVRNNPVGKTDPTGKCIEDACVGEIALGAAAWAVATKAAADKTV
jgi:RHS repeat-associated protein